MNVNLAGYTFYVDLFYLSVGFLIFDLIMLIVAIVLMVKLSKMKKRYKKFMAGEDGKSLENKILEQLAEIENLKNANSKNEKDIAQIKESLLDTMNKIGIVKYDAFNEMGGKLSFAVALLNDKNNGFIINAMHSREGCYTYIKEIIRGESFIALGEEEKKALDEAINGASETVE